MSAESKIILAIDTTDLSFVRGLIEETRPYIGVYKFGLEFYLKHGHSVLKKIIEEEEIKLFLDLKLHDIPNTVGKASAAVIDLDPLFLTVHASGGKEMVSAAAKALPETLITAVTILTSLDETAISSVGIRGPLEEAVVRLAEQATQAGARALVASPHEVSSLKRSFPGITTITPGIRPPGEKNDDQRRTMTPREAIDAGSDYLVVGRPIASAKFPALAAEAMFNSLA